MSWWAFNPNIKAQSLRRRPAIVNAVATNGDTPLHVAMRSSDENQCLILTKLLVEAGCSPCALDADDKPPIQVAVTQGFVSVVEYLFSRDVPLPSRILYAALQVPVVKRVEMIHLLISKGANVHALNPDGDTLLHVNVRSPDRFICQEIAERLIKAGCNPLTRNMRGETPLDIAVKQGYYEAINYLIMFSSSSEVLSLLQDPATQASIWYSLTCNTDSLRFQPEQKEKVFGAVDQFTDDEDRCLELAQTFAGNTGDLFTSSSGSTRLLDIAVRRGFSKVVEFLHSQAVPVPPSLLFTALYYRLSMIPSLVCKGADVHVRDENGDTLLHTVMRTLEETQCRAIAQALVEAGCDPFALNSANKQPILWSTDEEDECLGITKILCEAGFSLLAPNACGETPLHIAVSRGFTSVVDYLLFCNVPLPSDILFYALNVGSSFGEHDFKWTPMIALLVHKGAEIHARDEDGDTVLHCAMGIVPESQCLEVTKFLIAAGCDPHARDATGLTPLELATTREHSKVAEYLRRHSAESAPLLKRTVSPVDDVRRVKPRLLSSEPDDSGHATSSSPSTNVYHHAFPAMPEPWLPSASPSSESLFMDYPHYPSVMYPELNGDPLMFDSATS